MFFRLSEFNGMNFSEINEYSDDFYYKCRKLNESIISKSRDVFVEGKNIPAGDLLTYHYEIASQFVTANDSVLDIACGDGHGSRLLAAVASSCIGADIDLEMIKENQTKYSSIKNLMFETQDVTNLTYKHSSFDAVISMETIEHVYDMPYISEIHRVLNKDGTFILSTPQNSRGKIPVNYNHLREYSLNSLIQTVSEKFIIKHIYGFKAGRVHFEDDPIGTNTLLVLRKRG
jgi:2-polyprenyl-3-methyl-5-hydroxy-6-metoxy-1,4-benzoquinol methylase